MSLDAGIFSLCYFLIKWSSLVFLPLCEGNLCLLLWSVHHCQKVGFCCTGLNSAGSQSWKYTLPVDGIAASHSGMISSYSFLINASCYTDMCKTTMLFSAVSLRTAELQCQDISPWLFCYIVTLFHIIVLMEEKASQSSSWLKQKQKKKRKNPQTALLMKECMLLRSDKHLCIKTNHTLCVIS